MTIVPDHKPLQAHDYCKDVVSTLREPFLVLDGDLVVRSANRAFYTSFGANPKDIEGRRINELGDGQWNTPILMELLKEVLTEDRPFEDYALESDFPGVGRRSKLLNARRVRIGGHASDLILVGIEDVTARTGSLKLLEASEIRYRRLFEAAEDGILILNEPLGTIDDANPFIQKLLGYSKEELLGKQLWEIGLFADIDANKAMFEELQRNSYVRYDHLPLRTKEGRSAQVEFVSNVYAVDQTKVIQCNIRDISERVHLETRVASQSADLADLHRRKDEFLAMLAHELRNPLSPIVTSAAVLQAHGKEDSVQRHAREVIERQVVQLTRLVDDLLEVSRVTLGRIQLSREVIDLRGVVRGAAASARALIERSGHELFVELAPESLWVLADASRMEQVAVNLLNNSAKYMEAGGHVWLGATREGDDVVLSVRDSGIGIAADVLPHVFELFSQGPRSLDRSEGGLGIGLNLASKIVELHGGTIAAESAGPHEGSEFTVRLPAVAPPGEVRPDAPENQRESAKSRHRVLVVDDNVDAADGVTLLLEYAGYDTRAVYTGPDALEEAAHFKPAAVILDLGLPNMDGYEVARRLRRDPDQRHVALIALTGYGQASDRQRTQEAGFDHHVVKPGRPREVEHLLAALFEGRQRDVKIPSPNLSPLQI